MWNEKNAAIIEYDDIYIISGNKNIACIPS